jgi:hypothetical protein
MNERIQELAYEAEDYADGIVDQGGEFHPAYTQRLAELIVRECQTRVEQYICDCGEIGSLPDTVIKKHFGVEE